MQFPNDLMQRSRVWPLLAPSQACPIIGADARERGDARLEKAPVDGEPARPCLENDSRLARLGLAGAIQM